MSEGDFLDKINSKIAKTPKVIRYPLYTIEVMIVICLFTMMVALFSHFYDIIGAIGVSIFKFIF